MKKDATIICIIAGCLVLLDSIYLWLMKNAFNQQISRIQGSPIYNFTFYLQ